MGDVTRSHGGIQDPEARAQRSVYRRAWNLQVNVVAASFLVSAQTRMRIYRRCGIEVETPKVQPGCWFFGHDVAIGPDTWIGHRCYFDSTARTEIGRSCDLGMEVMLCTSTHEPGTRQRRAGRFAPEPIAIGDGVWIGTRSMVLPGVTVGDGCVIAAGSVVSGDCEPQGLYAGVPAKRVRDLP
jgi:acetyltransferase-like isoleucine patch superfamily enzyme